MHRKLLATTLTLVFGTGFVCADLLDVFDNYETVSDVGVSGLHSSYSTDTFQGNPISGSIIATQLPAFGPQRVSYPHGVGEVPSPGGSIGQNFDEGILGVRMDDENLWFRLATTLNPQTGYYHSGWRTNYGQGDLFVSVEDHTGISHFALLNTWARDNSGDPLQLNGGHFSAARNFHVGRGGHRSNLEGHLVQFQNDDDVIMAGGRGAYNACNAPDGLDLRVFASGGLDLGGADLTIDEFTDQGRTWYVETWTVSRADLSSDAVFDMGLHASPSCGNDQIGGTFSVPEPSSVMLVLGGLASMLVTRRQA